MAHGVITISHQLGSGGYVVAQKAAEQLGRAKPGLLDRFAAGTQLYLAVIQNAVTEAALQDNVVLVGRGGQWLLRGVPHALRVRVVGPLDTRVRWLVEHAKLGGTRDAVAALVRRNDADKAGRMRFLYERDLDDPQLYDLVLNTHHGDLDGAAAAIVVLARRPALATTDQGRRIVTDRALAARVRVALMSHEDTRDARHETVEAQEGRVHVTTAGALDAVARVAGAVEGVVDVTTEPTPVLPPMPLM